MAKIPYENLPSTNTPINATNLIAMQTTDTAIMYAPYGISMSNLTGWTQYDVDFNASNDTVFATNNSNAFERSGNQIKCKFSGLVLVLKYVYHNLSSELDIPDSWGTAANASGKINSTATIETVNNGDYIYFKFVQGETAVTFYNARFIVIRLS